MLPSVYSKLKFHRILIYSKESDSSAIVKVNKNGNSFYSR